MNSSAPNPPLSDRTAACLAVENVLGGRGFVQEALRTWRSQGRLAPRDAGFAMQAALGAIRHVYTLRAVLSSVGRFDPGSTPLRTQAVLLTAAYQMLWMDRVPVFAAVNEAVELAGRLVSPGAGRMVNALLRRLSGAIAARRTPWSPEATDQLRTGFDDACRLTHSILPAPPTGDRWDALAIAAGETQARLRALAARHGPPMTTQIAWASQGTPAIVIHRNPQRIEAGAFREAIATLFGAGASGDGECAVVSASAFRGENPLLASGQAFVQDFTAAEAARVVAAAPGERVLDLCAAPGGKSVALAIAMRDQGRVVACDVDAERLTRVSQNAARLGLACIEPRLIAAGADLCAVLGSVDAALVDAPCSNSGVIARRPEARLGLTPQKLASLTALQLDLLGRAAACVRPGGRLIYSTCSIEPEENDGVIAAFLAGSAAWRLDESRLTLPTWGREPHAWRDGGYCARLVRSEIGQ